MASDQTRNGAHGAQHWAALQPWRTDFWPSFWLYPRPDNARRIIPANSPIGYGSYPFWYKDYNTDSFPYHTMLHERVRGTGGSEEAGLLGQWDENPTVRNKPMTIQAFTRIKALIDEIRVRERAGSFNWTSTIDPISIGPLVYRNEIAAALERWKVNLFTLVVQSLSAKTTSGHLTPGAAESAIVSQSTGWTSGSFKDQIGYSRSHSPGGSEYSIQVNRMVRAFFTLPLAVRPPDPYDWSIEPGDYFFPTAYSKVCLAIQVYRLGQNDPSAGPMTWSDGINPGIDLLDLSGNNPFNDVVSILETWDGPDFLYRYDPIGGLNIPSYWELWYFHDASSWWDWDAIRSTDGNPPPGAKWIGAKLTSDNLAYPSGGSYAHPDSAWPVSDSQFLQLRTRIEAFVYVDDVDDIGPTA